ncbi:snapalysin family zinc-dependent metalloprotease [Streptomyces sp. NPDC020801]|uniref:snapalysin family zinc-dependent metalloprotease n=1 Tax=unclassified Streptomyces TaxID=2593676 RepID=UPI00378FF2A7
MKPSPASHRPTKISRRLISVALGLGLASAALGTASAVTAPSGSATARSGSAESAADNKAFFEAVEKSVAKEQAAHPNLQSVTVTYNASQAPSFGSQISSAASIWNSSVSNVQLQETSGNADITYTEGSDPNLGSHASTDGHGHGTIFLDKAQMQQNDPVRIAAHETGHALGLPDHYSGPCSELMSGIVPGPSCHNTSPNADERSRVEQLWANGLANALTKTNQTIGAH